MTASNVAATQQAANAFLSANFPWVPLPTVVEWDNTAGGSSWYTGKDGATISVPKYSDSWNDASHVLVVHECGHVVFFYVASKWVPVVRLFGQAFGVDVSSMPLPNEILAEHFARAYVDGYDGHNYPQLVGLVPFDAAKMRAFAEGLATAQPVVNPTTTVVTPTGQPKVVAAIPPEPPIDTVVVDFFGPHDASFYVCLASNGVAGIARYLVEDPANDKRAITAQEVADAHAAVLGIHFFYEMNPTYAQYFTFAQGQHDARAALAHLRLLGAPHPTVVYFTVDAPPSRIPPEVLDAYFNGIEDVMTNEDDGLLVDGLYGYEAHVEYARQKFPNVAKHLAQTYGTPRGPLDLWQHEQQTMCGVAVDIDAATVSGWEEEMDDQRVRTIIADYLNTTYGPALEAELAQRFGQNSDNDIARAVSEAVAAVGAKLTA